MIETETKEKAPLTVKELLGEVVDSRGFAKMSEVETSIQKFKDGLAVKDKDEDTAEMSERGLAGLAKMEVFGVEAGKIAIGTFGAVFACEILEGFLAAQSEFARGISKLALGGMVAKWGRKWVGGDAANAVALVMGVFGLSQVLPVDKWALRLATKVREILPGTIKVIDSPRGNVLGQAEQILNPYHSQVVRRLG